ncbi:MAG: hypothetical protein GF404_13595 [candidate division Zixibacteria bacterium]|nr:hypothetical protein [candidate division Zixibacteria bacterium]
MLLNQTSAFRTILIILVVVIVVAILASFILVPRTEMFFLKRGINYASEKLNASLPSVEGFNPDIHPVDPLIVRTSFDALSMALVTDSVRNDDFKRALSRFMTTFKNSYLDQTIVPREQILLADRLDSIVRATAKIRFPRVHTILLKHFIAFEDTAMQNYRAVLTFDSLALYSEHTASGMFAPLSLELVCETYNKFEDLKISSQEMEELKSIIRRMERFQLRDEFAGVMTMLRSLPEYDEFQDAEEFTLSAAIVRRALRNPEFDFYRIKPTLRSFILLWNEQKSAEDFERFDLVPLYEFVRFMRSVVERKLN